jgi:lysophospholipase L1-like esterase
MPGFQMGRIGLGISRRGGGRSPLRVASIQNRIPTTKASRTLPDCAIRWPHYLGADHSALVVSNLNWYQNAGEILTGNGFTIVSATIENDGGTLSAPLTFGGSRSKVIADGDTDIQSDPLGPSAFGLSKFSRSERWWVKAHIRLASAAHSLPMSDQRFRTSVTGSQVSWFDPAATTPSNIDTAGQWTFTGTAPDQQTIGYCPILLGYPLADGPSFMGLGNSIFAGSGDSAVTFQQFGGGSFQRSMRDSAGANPLPALNFARTGATTAHFLGANTRWLPYRRYAKYAIEELGTNDIGSGGTGVVATIQANLQSIWTLLREGGVRKIVRTKYLPRTTSTDSWATTANQTPATGWATGAKSSTLNDWFDARLAAGEIDAVVAMAAARDVTLPDRWPANGTANYATADGLHPSSTFHEFMAVDVRGTIAAFT